jgi:diketogulonate reductase-like aldo/keto reductase
VPLDATLGALADLCRDGLAATWGLSNFQGRWLARAADATPPGMPPAFNQVPYSIANRCVEDSVLQDALAHARLVLAWSPLGHGHMRRWPGYGTLAAVAAARGATPAQVALAFLAQQPGVIAIPRAADPEHARANALAGAITLDAAETAALVRAFPRGGRTRFPTLPPLDPIFRFVWWLERRQHGAAPVTPDR